MKVVRSSRASLKFTNQKKKRLLHDIQKEYSRVCNIFIDLFWLNNFTTKDLTRNITNIPETWLSARMRQNCAREALSSCDAALQLSKEKEKTAIKPQHYGNRMVLSSQIAKVERGNKSFDLVVTLSSIGNGVKVVLPLRSHRHMQFFSDWKMSNSVTVFKNSIQFSYEKNIDKRKGEKALGVDVGINKLLVTSNGKSYGDKTKSLIAKIRRKKTHSKAHKKARIELKEYINTEVKRMFSEHEYIDCFVFENIKNLKNGKNSKRGYSFRKVLHNWNYRQLLNYSQMQTETRRSSFRSVSPYKTSQTCPEKDCNHVERGNRVGEQFTCLRCGYSNDADIVGSINIVTRFTTGKYGSCFKAETIL